MKISQKVYESILGPIYLRATDHLLLSLDFNAPERPNLTGSNALLDEASKQLDEYFNGKRKGFDLPFEVQGTSFQKRVLEAMSSIPYGGVISYSKLASQIGHPMAFRAVGNACNRNKIPLIIPCHRVVGVSDLGGFGCGLDKKKFLLELEEPKY
jgi:methylated-DNA-[protein]-cysteine S-methyltransferase